MSTISPRTDEVRTTRAALLLAVALLALGVGARALAEEVDVPEAAAAAPAEAKAKAPAAPVSPEESEAQLMERARAYWEARVARNPQVYEFYPPPEIRPEGMVGTHGEGGAVAWSDFEIEAVKAEGESGLVQVRARMHLGADYEARIPEAMRDLMRPTVMEEWVHLEGVWYKKPIEQGLSRFMRGRREQAERERAAAAAAAQTQKKGAEATHASSEPPAQRD